MRFMRRNLKPVYVFCPKETDSGYVGTKTEYVPSHKIWCVISPAENKITAEIYGKRVYDMISLMCDTKEDIQGAHRLSLDGFSTPEYKIVSVKKYSVHTEVLAEVIGVEG